MQITRTHNGYHLGDNLVHLNFLRKVALANPDRQFVHAAQWQYLIQLRDVVADVPNIRLEEYGYRLPSDSIDAWRGANNFWYARPNRNDFVTFHLEAWFPYLAERMGVENPVTKRKDMLFDYPLIRMLPTIQKLAFELPFDLLVINSPPGSGQWPNYDLLRLADLVSVIGARGIKVMTTHPVPKQYIQVPVTAGLSVTGVGHLSLYCHAILMVSTGPSWPTFNVWNQDTVKLRVILLEPERVNLAPNTVHCATIDEAEKVLKDAGLL